MIGHTISHFEILRKVGEGGMGVVYEARDTLLDRSVALKFLPPYSISNDSERARLVHEAKAAASLQHPNICPVYEIVDAGDQTFIAMAYLPGETLEDRIKREPLLPEEAVDLAIQIIDGLQAAHSQGVVHRDIKPANIMINDNSQAVIMDFGLAKMTDATRLTRTGSTMGTVGYMSPEQIRGEMADHRTDIWSIGVLLHEMLTGKPPFSGDNAAALIYSVITQDPELPTSLRSELPPGLDAIVAKALTKDADFRYQQASDLMGDLMDLRTDPEAFPAGRKPHRRPSGRGKLIRMGIAGVALAFLIVVGWWILDPGTVGARVKSVAILPLENLSGQEGHEVYADGLTMELISTLGREGSGYFTVTGRRTSMRFKGSDLPLADIVKELNVDAVVEGSVQLADNKIHITAELIKADNEQVLWTDVFDGDLEDILSLQEYFAKAVAGAVGARISSETDQEAVMRPPVDPEAYRAYLEARMKGYFAREQYQRAVDIDSTFAAAWAGLSWEYSFEATFGITPTAIAFPPARFAAEKALDLDPDLAMGHAAMGNVLMTQDWDWPSARREYLRAIEAEPTSAEVHTIFATDLIRAGRFDEGLAMIRNAALIDPMNQYTQLNVGFLMLYSGRYEEAITHFETMIELFPESRVTSAMKMERGWAFGMLGQHEKAAGISKELHGTNASYWSPGSNWNTARAFARSSHRQDVLDKLEAASIAYEESPSGQGAWLVAFGHTAIEDHHQAMVWLERSGVEFMKEMAEGEPQTGTRAFRQARLYAWLGEKELSLQWLSIAFEFRTPLMFLMNIAPEFDSVREEVEFKDIAKRIWS